MGENVVHSALWTAAYAGDTDRVRILVEHGADVNEFDSNVHFPYPLWAACKGRHVFTAQVLIDAGANIESTNVVGNTPLLYFGAFPSILKMLIKANANIHAVDRNGNSILLRVVKSNNQEALMELYDRGMYLSHRDNFRFTCLHVAATVNQVDMILTLLDLNMDIDSTSSTGITALHAAATHGHVCAVAALLIRNADIHIKNADNETAAQAAQRKNHAQIARMIENEELRRDRILQPRKLAFAMGEHSRIGQGSVMNGISPEIARIVSQFM
jgi:ankyrin repeat protein